MSAWDAPDPAAQPVATIDAGLAIEVVERRDDGWAKVVCDNGWTGWVDGRVLQPLVVAPAPALSAEELRGPVKVRGIRITTPLIAGVVLLAGSFLPWVSQLAVSQNAFRIPINVLIDPKKQNAGGLKVGFVLVVLGALAVATGLGRLPAQVGRVAGGLAALVATMFLGQLQRALGQAQVATVFGVLGMGVYLTMLGGVIAAMSSGPPKQGAAS
jgi:hypothetical protein